MVKFTLDEFQLISYFKYSLVRNFVWYMTENNSLTNITQNTTATSTPEGTKINFAASKKVKSSLLNLGSISQEPISVSFSQFNLTTKRITFFLPSESLEAVLEIKSNMTIEDAVKSALDIFR